MARRLIENSINAALSADLVTDKFSLFNKTGKYKFNAAYSGVYCLQYSFDRQNLAVGYGNGYVEILHPKASEARLISTPLKGTLPIAYLRFHPKNQKLLLALTPTEAYGRVVSVDITSEKTSDLITEDNNEIYGLDFHLDGERYATGGKDATVRLYDSKTNTIIRQLDPSGYTSTGEESSSKGHSKRVFCVKFHPTRPDVCFTGGWDACVKMWDMRTKEGLITNMHGPNICGEGIDLKDNTMVTGAWCATRAFGVWDLTTFKNIHSVKLTTEDATTGEFIMSCQICDNNVALVGSSGTESMQAINYRDQEVIGILDHKKPVTCVDSIMGGRQFVCGGASKHLDFGILV